MERTKKSQVVSELKEILENASSCIAVDFGGVSSATFTPLRKECAKANVRLAVVKNSLARIALKGTAFEGMEQHLKGMSCLVCTMDSDQVVGAKLVKKYVAKDKNIEVKGGMLDGKLLSVEEVKALSDLPGKEELQAKLLATMLAVPQNFVRLLNAVPGNFVQLLAAYKDKLENEA